MSNSASVQLSPLWKELARTVAEAEERERQKAGSTPSDSSGKEAC